MKGSLLLHNGVLTETEEMEMLEELQALLHLVSTNTLEKIRKELLAYDPNSNHWADVSSVKSVCSSFFKQFSISSTSWQRLFLLFSRNPQRPREVFYDKMIDHLLKIKDQNSSGHSPELVSVNRRFSATPQYQARGDDKLQADLAKYFQKIPIESGRIQELVNYFESADPNNDSLSWDLMRKVLDMSQVGQYFNGRIVHCDKLLDRCYRWNHKTYDWQTFVQFLSQAQPLVIAEEKNELSHDDESSSDGVSIDANHTPEHRIHHDMRIHESPKRSSIQENGQHARREILQRIRRDSIQNKREQLSEIEMQIRLLNQEAKILRQEISLDDCAKDEKKRSDFCDQAVKVSINRLKETLNLQDRDRIGWVPANKAALLLKQYNDLHQLGLQQKSLAAAITFASDDEEKNVSVEKLIEFIIKITNSD